MNRRILAIALPSIVTNITVPLLGLIDITIAGHLGRTEYIGAIAVGAMMFNLIYWNFGFLRMGTAGMTAQAYGRGDHPGAASVLLRAASLAAAIAAAILLLQVPLQWLLLSVVAPSPNVEGLARQYFYICVWGAPAMLIDMAIKGWFIGMQDSRTPMLMAIGINVANIAASLLAVYAFDMGFAGITVGTVIAEYAGMAFGIAVIVRRHGRLLRRMGLRTAVVAAELRRFFGINADIFLRSACLMAVNLFFVSVGARSGDITLAVNALIMQLFTLFSYFMDGFAFSGEALAGRYAGARDRQSLYSCIRHIFAWGAGVAAAFMLAYMAGADIILIRVGWRVHRPHRHARDACHDIGFKRGVLRPLLPPAHGHGQRPPVAGLRGLLSHARAEPDGSIPPPPPPPHPSVEFHALIRDFCHKGCVFCYKTAIFAASL